VRRRTKHHDGRADGEQQDDVSLDESGDGLDLRSLRTAVGNCVVSGSPVWLLVVMFLLRSAIWVAGIQLSDKRMC
jgi:hypothetical protein